MSATITQYFDRLRKASIPLAVPILLLYVAAGIFLVPEFLSFKNFTSIVFSAAVLLPAVAGTQLLLVLGRFDLSIGATASLSGMVAGLCLNQYGSLGLAVCSGLIVGVVVGWTNGHLVSRLGVDPLIATLAVMGMTRSLALVINGSQIVAGLPSRVSWITEARPLGIPVLILFAIFFTGVATLVTNHSVLFRRFYAAGTNATAASHTGVDVARLVTVGYMLAGLGAAFTGLIQVSRTLSASPLIFETLPLDAIAACMIGGSSLAGGRGKILGASIGLIVIIATRNLVVMLGIPVDWKDFTTGTLLLLAVVGPPIVKALRKRFSSNTRNGNKKGIRT